MIDTAAGTLDEWSDTAAENNRIVAMTLEVTTGTGLTKCMML